MAGRLAPGVRSEHHVFVDDQRGLFFDFHLNLRQFTEVSHGGGRDTDGAIVADVAGLNAVVAVVLHIHAKGLGLHRHAGVLGDEHDLSFGSVAQIKRRGDDPVVGCIDLHENGAEAFGFGAIKVIADEGLVDDDAEFAAIAQFGVKGARFTGIALGNFLQRSILKQTPDGAIDPSGAGAELALLSLETIQFGQDFDGHCDNMLVELEQGLWIVNQNVGVQDVSLFHVPIMNLSPPRGQPVK